MGVVNSYKLQMLQASNVSSLIKPVSLSKASRDISDFASFENNGMSEVVSLYFNRASEAFSSLVQLQKDLKHPQSSLEKDWKQSCSGNESAASLRIGETMYFNRPLDDKTENTQESAKKEGGVAGERRGVESGTEKPKRRDEKKKEDRFEMLKLFWKLIWR